MVKRVAVVLAGGLGARTGLGMPKQLIKLGNRTLLEHVIERCHAHPQVDRVVVMMTPSHLDSARTIAASYAKVTDVLAGGETRNESTLGALSVIDDDDHVMLHDAARPLVSDRIISDCLAALDHYAAVDVAVPSADTIIEVDADDVICSIPSRRFLRRGQTPQAFHAGTLRRAYELAANDAGFGGEFSATDDCGVVLRYLPQVPIKVVPGDERNLKVTGLSDVVLAETLLRLSDEELREELLESYFG